MIILVATMLVLEGLIIYLYAVGIFPTISLKAFQVTFCILLLVFALVVGIGLIQYS